jgi:multisubunit Na+/H+ antiporter MnhF subunit
MSVSGLLALGWYAVGEWGLRGHTTKPQTWLLIWLLMLAVVIVVSFLAIFLGPQASENELVLDLFYAGSGTLFFYLACVFRSPTATKYLLWPARLVRR